MRSISYAGNALVATAVLMAIAVCTPSGVKGIQRDTSCLDQPDEEAGSINLLQKQHQLAELHGHRESLPGVSGVELSPVIEEESKPFWTVAHQNKIYGGPGQVDHFVIYDAISGHISTVPVGVHYTVLADQGGTRKMFGWMGIGLDPDLNLIYASPFNSEYLIILSTINNQVSAISTSEIATGPGKWNGIVGYKGKAYASPSDADQILVYDSSTGLISGVSTASVATGTWKWAQGQDYGDYVYFGPCAAKVLLKYDTITHQATGIPVTSGTMWGWNGITIYKDKIFLSPNTATYVVVYNLLDNSVSNISTPMPECLTEIPPKSEGEWCKRWGGGVGHEGKVYMGSYHTQTILVVDAETLELSSINIPFAAGQSGIGIIDKTLYQMPYHGSTKLLTVALD